MNDNTSSIKRVLVTGATGFLGQNVIDALKKENNIEIVAACRNKARLPASFTGEVREGDLCDASYRQRVVEGIDVVCHAGTWSAFWGHAKKERSWFYEPCVDLIEQSIAAGVERFILASTVAIAAPTKSRQPRGDFDATAYTKFWPHLDRLIDADEYMKKNAGRGMQMINMRLGHFVGKGCNVGLVPALVPRLRTFMVPLLGNGSARMALVGDSDLGQGFARAAVAEGLNNYESFNICGPSFPDLQEVFFYIAEQTGSPKPFYRVPYFAGFMFGALMELIAPIMPKRSPFLTRSLVHVGRDWFCPSDYAREKLGYVPTKDWKVAVDESLEELSKARFPWPRLAQE